MPHTDRVKQPSPLVKAQAAKARKPAVAAHRVMSRAIQEATRNGEELVEWALMVFRCSFGQRAALASKLGLEKIDDALKLEVFNWLSDRGFGRPMQAIDITIDDDRSISDEELIDQLLRSFGPDELKAAAERMEKAAALTAGTGETIQ